MPQHTSKNYYKAELEEYEQLEEKEWEYWEQMYQRTKYDCDAWYYNYEAYTWSSAFNTTWTRMIGKRESIPICICCKKESCPYRGCTCDLCYEYKTTYNMKDLIKEMFTPQEILEAVQQHLLVHNCWCYDRVKSHIVRRRVDGWIRPRRSSSVVAIPFEYEDDVLTTCVINILDKKIRERIKIYHEDMELHGKRAILAKYGMTLEDYHQTRLERQKKLEEVNKPIVIKEEPKQKFYKIRIPRKELL